MSIAPLAKKKKNKKTPRYEKTLTQLFPLAIYFLAQVYFGERHFNCIGTVCYSPVPIFSPAKCFGGTAVPGRLHRPYIFPRCHITATYFKQILCALKP